MIDYILRYADEATAKTALASRLKPDDQGVLQWPGDYCLPGVQMWRQSQDTIDGNGNTVHAYLTGFYILVSLPIVLPALRDLAAVQVVVDRDKAVARQAGAVIKSNVSNAILQDIRWSPVYAGSNNPWGTWQ